MDPNDQNSNTGQNPQSTQANAGDEVFDNGLSYEDIIQKDVLELMGFTKLTEEKSKELHEKIEVAIQNRVAARIFDALSEEDRKQYEKLTDEQKFKEANDFLLSKNIDANNWLVQETIVMKLELYEDGKVVKKRAEDLIKNANKQEN